MKRIALTVLLSALLPLSVLGQQTPADLILLNGKVFTSDAAKPYAEAVAIRGKRIIAVGTSAEIKSLAGAKTQLIDLQSRVVIPGINDAHFHFMPDPKGYTLQFQSMNPSSQVGMKQSMLLKRLPNKRQREHGYSAILD